VLRFDPFRDIDRLTEQLLGSPAGSARTPRFMPLDLYRSGDHYVLHADLPGVDPGSVDVSVDSGTLTITAQRSAHNEADVQWVSSERFTGTFQRQISLSEGVDPEGISATYENGVLTVTLPVARAAEPRRIQSTRGADASPSPQASGPPPAPPGTPARTRTEPAALGRGRLSLPLGRLPLGRLPLGRLPLRRLPLRAAAAVAPGRGTAGRTRATGPGLAPAARRPAAGFPPRR